MIVGYLSRVLASFGRLAGVEEMRTRKRKVIGKHIVADPEICGDQLTFLGTRILVQDVLDMVAKGYAWSRISEECFGRVSREDIAEAVELAREALMKKAGKPRRVA